MYHIAAVPRGMRPRAAAAYSVRCELRIVECPRIHRLIQMFNTD